MKLTLTRRAQLCLPGWRTSCAQLRDVAEGYCPDGYQNNEGGYGTLTVYPFLGFAQLEHYDNFEESEDMETVPAALPEELRQRLSHTGISSVAARFDGFGDSGQMEEVTVLPESAELDGDLEEDLENFLLDQLVPGWENNEGGYGDFTVDVQTGEVTAETYSRVQSVSEVQLTRWKWRQ